MVVHQNILLWSRTGEVFPLTLASFGVALLAGRNPGGIYKRHDPELPWTAAKILAGPHLNDAPAWNLAVHNNIALAGIASYVYRSTNNGGDWLPVAQNIPPGATAIAFHLSDDLFLAAMSLHKAVQRR